jgi:hypothetical protein
MFDMPDLKLREAGGLKAISSRRMGKESSIRVVLFANDDFIIMTTEGNRETLRKEGNLATMNEKEVTNRMKALSMELRLMR